MKYIYVDCEYNRSTDEVMNVVCVSLQAVSGTDIDNYDLWLDDHEENRAQLLEMVEYYVMEGYVFVAFAVIAESRALHSLGFDPRRITWVDLHLEWRMLCNHNHNHGCGKQLIKGEVKMVYPPIPKYEQTEDDRKRKGGAVSYNLSAAIFKILGVNIDTDHKDEMRNLIIAGGEFDEESKQSILKYCASDVKYLHRLHQGIYKAIHKMLIKSDRRKLPKEMYARGEYAARAAVMESVGYPIDYEATKAFASSARNILFEIQRSILEAFPEVQPFELGKSGERYKMNVKKIREWVDKQGYGDRWMKTDKGSNSLSLDAFQKHYESRGPSLGSHMLKLLRTKQSLNGFMPGGKKTLWDSVGSDQRVRPYMGIYRAATARSQPSSTGFIPLKSSWMRSLILPQEGRSIVALDYSQQEFLIAGLLSHDMNMVRAYHSGDPYLATGKIAKAIPEEATKESHPLLRDKFKSTVLGIQYLMGSAGLAVKLTTDTGVEHTQDEAQALIDQFQEAYYKYQEWRTDIWAKYRTQGYLKLPCGWVVWGDNKNRRSLCNWPIQGCGSSIMRKGVALAQDEGLDIIFTLHDALYAECRTDQVQHTVNELAHAMKEAMQFYFRDTPMERYANCRLDPKVWGPDWDGVMKVSTDIGEVIPTPILIEDKGVEEYKKYRKYFVPSEEMEILLGVDA